MKPQQLPEVSGQIKAAYSFSRRLQLLQMLHLLQLKQQAALTMNLPALLHPLVLLLGLALPKDNGTASEALHSSAARAVSGPSQNLSPKELSVRQGNLLTLQLLLGMPQSANMSLAFTDAAFPTPTITTTMSLFDSAMEVFRFHSSIIFFGIAAALDTPCSSLFALFIFFFEMIDVG